LVISAAASQEPKAPAAAVAFDALLRDRSTMAESEDEATAVDARMPAVNMVACGIAL
jgi:hypothetical protein